MNALLVGIAATILGVALHGVFLRHLPPKWRLPTLPVFLLMTLAVLAAGVSLSAYQLRPIDGFVALVLVLSLGFAYALLLNGVLHDSPTLALVDAIEAHGPNGMPVEEFDTCVAKHPFFANRLAALIAVRELHLQDGQLRLSGKAVHLLRLGDTYRRLRGKSANESG